MLPLRLLPSGVLATALILSLACSSGGGGSGISGRVQLSGTVAAGTTIGATSIAFRDSKGTLAFATTQPDGTFSADLSTRGLTLPVIFRAPNPETGKFMYSYASAQGTSNIHPLTDPILRMWFKAKGLTGNIDSDFISATPFALPTDSEIAFIKTALSLVVADYLTLANLPADSFDLITSPFAANGTGFDSILKGARIDTTDNGELSISVTPYTSLDTSVTRSGYVPAAYLDSSVIALATDSTPPALPTGLVAAPICGNKVLITWSTSTSADVASYRLYEETHGYLATATYPAYLSTALITHTTFTFSATAVDAAGNESVRSSGSPVVLGECALPIVPAALSSAPTVTALSSSRLRVDWTSTQSNIIEYRVYSVGTASYIARTPVKTFTDFQLPPATQRCYTVTLVNVAGESLPSAQACGTTLPGVPPAPTNVAAAKSGPGQVAVTWSAAGNAATYRLYHAKQSGLTKANYASLTGGTLITGITGTGTTVSGLAAGTPSYFIVSAVNSAGEESVESMEASATP